MHSQPTSQRSTLWLLLFLMIAPLLVVTGFGLELIQRESSRNTQQQQQLAWLEFQQWDQRGQQYITQVTQQLQQHSQMIQQHLTQDDLVNRIRQLIRQSPWLVNVWLYNDTRQQRYFPPAEMSTKEAAFLQRTDKLWSQQHLFQAADMQEQTISTSSNSRLNAFKTEVTRASGWINWFEQNHPNPIYWIQLTPDIRLAFELASMRLLSDLINLLPTQVDDSGEQNANHYVQLLNNQQQPLFGWGDPQWAEKPNPLRWSLSPPLDHLSVQFNLGAPVNYFSNILLFSVIMLLIVLLSALLALLLYRQRRKEIQVAQQRVNFVNQVSHELKTPMTNIRLYGELLANRLDEDDTKSSRYLHIIQQETLRLSRLIDNVLNFSRLQRHSFKLNIQQQDLAECVQAAIEQFEPAFERHQLQVRFDNQVTQPLFFDGCVLSQILHNLLSNAEKYAHNGHWLQLKAYYQAPMLHLSVQDNGPGINSKERHKIFQPFYRIHDQLTEGVSGTGIGLSLSKDLAQQHGGDLQLMPSEQGCCFELTLNVMEHTHENSDR